jgi:hypothetical protein
MKTNLLKELFESLNEIYTPKRKARKSRITKIKNKKQ